MLKGQDKYGGIDGAKGVSDAKISAVKLGQTLKVWPTWADDPMKGGRITPSQGGGTLKVWPTWADDPMKGGKSVDFFLESLAYVGG